MEILFGSALVLLITLPVLGIMLLLMSMVLQWAYQIVVRRELRYGKACKIMLVLFLINAALNFVAGGVTVSMDFEGQQLADFILLPVIFLIGAGIYAYWLNDKRGRPIGWLKGLAVQAVFYAIVIGVCMLFAVPIVLLAAAQ